MSVLWYWIASAAERVQLGGIFFVPLVSRREREYLSAHCGSLAACVCVCVCQCQCVCVLYMSLGSAANWQLMLFKTEVLCYLTKVSLNL